jgi:hypothetical protein
MYLTSENRSNAHRENPYSLKAVNGTQANGSYMSHEKGVLFYRGVSPSKIGLIAPY